MLSFTKKMFFFKTAKMTVDIFFWNLSYAENDTELSIDYLFYGSFTMGLHIKSLQSTMTSLSN